MHKNEIKVPNPMLNLLKVASNASFNAFSIKLKKGYAIEKRIYFYIHVQNVHLTVHIKEMNFIFVFTFETFIPHLRNSDHWKYEWVFMYMIILGQKWVL